jgi:hypothetical protein
MCVAKGDKSSVHKKQCTSALWTEDLSPLEVNCPVIIFKMAVHFLFVLYIYICLCFYV